MDVEKLTEQRKKMTITKLERSGGSNQQNIGHVVNSAKIGCAHDLLRRREKSASRACPACNKLLTSRQHQCGNESGTETGGGASCNPPNVFGVNGNPADGVLSLDMVDILPPMCKAEGSATNEKTIVCNGLNNAAPNTTDLLLTTTSSPPKPLYCSNLSLASLSLRASSLTIDSARNATSSV